MPESISFDASWWDKPREKRLPGQSSSPIQPYKLVFEDSSILVIDKPAGLAVQSDRSGTTDNLLDLVRQSRAEESIYLVHRLDQPVCGLVVLAKSAQYQTALTRQMSTGAFSKCYRAIVCPAPAKDSGRLENHLCKQQADNFSRVVDDNDPEGSKKRACLNYQVDERMVWQGLTLAKLSIQLETGRHHQIRVQLSHAGSPIINDAKYGGQILSSHPGQLALQSCQLSFVHPATGKRLTFLLSPPDHEPWTFFSPVTHELGDTGKL